MPKYITNFLIKIDGSDVSVEFQDAIKEVVVDTSLDLPWMAIIRLHDPDLSWAGDTTLDIGKSLDISVQGDEGSAGGTTAKVLFKGEITALEPHFSAEANSEMIVRAYDKTHRLHRGKKTRTFLKMKDSDVVSTAAGEGGLGTSIDATTVVHEFIIQYNQTNWEFIKSRADRLGYVVYCEEGTLYFKKGETAPPAGPTLTFLENLTDFRPSYTTSQQAEKMTAKSWDPKLKTAISSQKTPLDALNQGGLGKTGGAAANSSFGSAEAISVDQPVFTTDEADAIANGISATISRDFTQAEGECPGHPDIKAGHAVTIQKVATRFCGSYFITSAKHIYNEFGYITQFSVSGRFPNTLHRLVGGDEQGERALVNGVVSALVTNLKDPDDLGRVKVKYAWLGEIESDWVRIATPMAGSSRGFLYFPEVNDEVLVAFEHGDIHRPVIVGALWSNVDKPPEVNSVAVGSDGKVNQRILKTRAGHLIMLDDKQGEEKISVKSKSGHEVIMDDKSGSEAITIKDKTGSNSMVITSSDNSMAIKVNGDFSVTANGKITLKSTQDISMESSGGNAKLKGMQLAMEGVSKSELKGLQVSINGSTQTEVKSGVMVQIQGTLVKIN